MNDTNTGLRTASARSTSVGYLRRLESVEGDEGRMGGTGTRKPLVRKLCSGLELASVFPAMV